MSRPACLLPAERLSPLHELSTPRSGTEVSVHDLGPATRRTDEYRDGTLTRGSGAASQGQPSPFGIQFLLSVTTHHARTLATAPLGRAPAPAPARSRHRHRPRSAAPAGRRAPRACARGRCRLPRRRWRRWRRSCRSGCPARAMPMNQSTDSTSTSSTAGIAGMIILIRLMKTSPSGSSLTPNSGMVKPAMTPTIRARTTWPNNERAKGGFPE
jgi:hypothetical protein